MVNSSVRNGLITGPAFKPKRFRVGCAGNTFNPIFLADKTYIIGKIYYDFK